MPSIRTRPESGTLFLDFRYRGKRCREQTLLPDTPSNRARLKRLADKIQRSIAQGTFSYGDYFPDSPRCIEFAEAQQPSQGSDAAPAAGEATTYPSFSEFCEIWFAESEPRWRSRYRAAVRDTLDKHVLPTFGHLTLDRITRAELLGFRANLAKRPGRLAATIGPARINKLMRITKAIVDEGCDRYGLTSPARGIKSLKQGRPQVQPFTLQEVNSLIATVRDDYRPYLTVRLLSGLRTGEVNGLQWSDVDWEANTIHVQRAVGRESDGKTKTDASNRFIPMVPQVREAVLAQKQQSASGALWIFQSPRGCPIDEVNFTNRVWYPLLRHLGLERRRPYQMRHTAATLMLAAGESPEWIARILGHTTTEMLFRTYSWFVPNLTRQDGHAFAGLVSSQMTQASPPTRNQTMTEPEAVPSTTSSPTEPPAPAIAALQSLTPEQIASLLALAQKPL